MANTEVGSAYVTVYPQTDGNFSKQVGAKIGDGVGKGLSARSVALGNLVSTGLIKAASAAAEGIGSIIGGVFSGLASLASGAFSGGSVAAGVVIGLALYFWLKKRNTESQDETGGTVDGETVETEIAEPRYRQMND